MTSKSTPAEKFRQGAVLILLSEEESRAEEQCVKREQRRRENPQHKLFLRAGREVIDVLLSRLYHVGDEHIAPEKAYHPEDIDDRADDQKTVDIILSDRSVQLNEREYNSVNKIRKQINRRGNSVSLLFVVIVADEVERLTVRDKEHEQYSYAADHQHNDSQRQIAVEILKDLCPVALLNARIGVGIIQKEISEEVTKAHAEMHHCCHKHKRSAQRSELKLFEDDQQDKANDDVH